jgi:lysophospholipase L1-like esterase
MQADITMPNLIPAARLILAALLLLVPSARVAAAPSPLAVGPTNAAEAKAIADGISRPVEKDARVPSNGKPWGINKAAVADPALPRVLLIGDSILNGYSSTVIKRLAGRACVDYWVTPACQSEGFNKMLAVVLTNGPYAVVHINLGLHGWQPGRIPAGQFEPLTKAFVEVIRQQSPRSKIIWASTTPIMVRGKPELEPERNPIILEHNRMAARVMAELKVPVNDLYSLMTNRLELKTDEFHWQDAARKIQGNAVADCVLRELAGK